MDIFHLRGRYAVLHAFMLFFLLASLAMRMVLYLSVHQPELSALALFGVFAKGFVYDTGVALFMVLFYSTYLLLLPQRIVKTYFNYIGSYFIVSVMVSIFSFFAEFTFWQEFESRFNFIAVDYLVYTFEVVNNINESYPLPYLISGVFIITIAIVYLFRRRGYFRESFGSRSRFKNRLFHFAILVLLIASYSLVVDNSWAEKTTNRYQGELSKAGIYSFFSAFRNNELAYDQFYPVVDIKNAFSILRNKLNEEDTEFEDNPLSIKRKVSHQGTVWQPNLVMVVVESLSADFMEKFGNKQELTPVLDSIAKNGIVFSRMYATGTRTVRGMEALSLAVPPTPGNSIVRRKNNGGLSTIGNIFRQKGYRTTFFYGGDGYFDNMNQYFGNNGFDIVDRGGRITAGDNYKGKRTILKDSEVSFENAWGVSDGDLFSCVIRDADRKAATGERFYNFVMTTSNHRPFTYPEGKIDIPSGSGREGAVKYSDYAIGEFLAKAAKRPWFKNTVFVFVGDHCASSAGKNEIDIAKYHVPAIIYNLNGKGTGQFDQMCSQIDLYPTLFGLLNWSYESNNYGQDIRDKGYVPRALLATYQKLGYMKRDSLVILSPNGKPETFIYDWLNNGQKPAKVSPSLLDEAIASYQTAYYLFKNGGLKLKTQPISSTNR